MEVRSQKIRNEKLNGALMFVAGGLLGAGMALLLAPQSGRRTRRDIVHLGKMAKKKSEQMSRQNLSGVVALFCWTGKKRCHGRWGLSSPHLHQKLGSFALQWKNPLEVRRKRKH